MPSENQRTNYRVFVSHASEDRWVAEQLARLVRSTGANPFLDASDIDHGDDFEEEIRLAMEGCDELLVLMTPWARDRSRYVWMEIGAAWVLKRHTVVILHGISPSDVSGDRQMPVRLKRSNLVAINDAEDYAEGLKRRIAAAGESHV